MMGGYLLDNNHLGAAVTAVSPIRERIYMARRSGVRVGTCIPVLCELEAGIQNSSNPQSCYRHLNALLDFVRLWPIDRQIAKLYGAIYLELQSRGRILSYVDIVLVALARHMDLTLLTSDRDFEAVPDLRKQNWLI